MTLASFIQPRAVVCVSYAHTAVLSRSSVCITHDEKCFVAPKHRIRREVVLLFIYRLYIFTLLNMRVIILVNILYLSFVSRPPDWEPLTLKSIYQHCLRDRSIGHPWSKWCFFFFLNIHFSFIWFHSICLFVFYLNSVNFFFFFFTLFYIKV